MDSIYTVEEISQYLKVSADIIEKEIALGRLLAMNVGGLTRIREAELNRYMETTSAVTAPKLQSQFQLKPTAKFSHKWPDNKVEEFMNAQEGVVSYAGQERHVRVGFTRRKSAGKWRLRSLVLVDRYATVEFVAPDETPKGKMASIVRDRNGKQLPVGATVPLEYQNLPVGAYRDVVIGPGASNGLAVICDAHDLEIMVKHALIRYQYRKDRA